MKQLGIERSDDVPRSDGDKRDWFRPKKERGKSTLEKYTCPGCGLNVRIGIKEDPGIIHHKCSVEKGENVFFVKFDGREHTIFESATKENKPKASAPTVIAEINEHLRANAPKDLKEFTVEGIAKKAGISEKMLQEWLESDAEFTTALGRLKDVQENDPSKTETEEDAFVNSMMIALLLLETKERHHKSENI